MSFGLYILRPDHTVVKERDLLTWGIWFETADRKVAETIIPFAGQAEGYMVSTVFLGLDHGFVPGAPPVLFETMTFLPREATRGLDGKLRDMRDEVDLVGCFDRYTTWAEAEEGHHRIVAMLLHRIAEAERAGAGALSGLSKREKR